MKYFLTTIIIIFSIISHISSNRYTVTNELLSCEGDDPKKGLCALLLRGADGNGVTKIQIKSDCDSDEICNIMSNISGNPDMLQCTDAIRAKDFDKECNYNGDCYSNICKNRKCSIQGEGQECDLSFAQCEKGLSCAPSLNKCVKLSKEGESCKRGEIDCDFGLGCNYSDNKCYKFGSLEEGRDCGGMDLICASGISYQNRCVTVQADGTCKNNLVGGGFICKSLQVSGATYSDDLMCEDYIGDSSKEENYACPISLVKSKIFQKYLDEYKDRHLDKYWEEEKYNFDKGLSRYSFTKKKMARLFTMYKYAPMFEVRGYLDSDGDMNDDYECEAKWLLKNLGGNSSGYLKFSFLLFGVLFAILF